MAPFPPIMFKSALRVIGQLSRRYVYSKNYCMATLSIIESTCHSWTNWSHKNQQVIFSIALAYLISVLIKNNKVYHFAPGLSILDLLLTLMLLVANFVNTK